MKSSRKTVKVYKIILNVYVKLGRGRCLLFCHLRKVKINVLPSCDLCAFIYMDFKN